MESRIAESIDFRYGPVALILTDVKPEGARQFKEGKWGCVMFLLGAVARGETAVFDRKTFGCWRGPRFRESVQELSRGRGMFLLLLVRRQ